MISVLKPNIRSLICDLLEQGVDDNQKCFTEKGIEIIGILSEHAKATRAYQANKERGEAFFASMSAWEMFTHMLQKIVTAPTLIHGEMSAILTIPHLNDAIKKEREHDEDSKPIGGCAK